MDPGSTLNWIIIIIILSSNTEYFNTTEVEEDEADDSVQAYEQAEVDGDMSQIADL